MVARGPPKPEAVGSSPTSVGDAVFLLILLFCMLQSPGCKRCSPAKFLPVFAKRRGRRGARTTVSPHYCSLTALTICPILLTATVKKTLPESRRNRSSVAPCSWRASIVQVLKIDRRAIVFFVSVAVPIRRGLWWTTQTRARRGVFMRLLFTRLGRATQT